MIDGIQFDLSANGDMTRIKGAWLLEPSLSPNPRKEV